jgi:hypothetical protein
MLTYGDHLVLFGLVSLYAVFTLASLLMCGYMFWSFWRDLADDRHSLQRQQDLRSG